MDLDFFCAAIEIRLWTLSVSKWSQFLGVRSSWCLQLLSLRICQCARVHVPQYSHVPACTYSSSFQQVSFLQGQSQGEYPLDRQNVRSAWILPLGRWNWEGPVNMLLKLFVIRVDFEEPYQRRRACSMQNWCIYKWKYRKLFLKLFCFMNQKSQVGSRGLHETGVCKVTRREDCCHCCPGIILGARDQKRLNRSGIRGLIGCYK